MGKVYCGRCKHFNTWVVHNKCRHPENIYTYISSATALNPPEKFKAYRWRYFDKNFNNNCKYYEPTLIIRIINYLIERLEK